MLRDWAEKEPETFHRFFWANHIGYAKFYEKVNDFGTEKLVLTRKMLFEDLKKCVLNQSGIASQLGDVKSILDVGCASGCLLYFIEKHLFPTATILEGIDIDKHLIEKGRAYLSKNASKICLHHADIVDLDRVIGERKYDIILCAGVLMYLNESTAIDVVRSMLNHCSGLVAIKGLAHPIIDNAKLMRSEPRMNDGAFIHNIDAMVKKANGKVIFRKWEGSKEYDGQTVYFVFCQPETYEPKTTK